VTRSPQEHEELMLTAAELYHYEGLAQTEVAARMGVTRWTVGRLLDDAKQAGIVRVVIDHPRARRHELELMLEKAFGLREAVVVTDQPRPADTLQLVGQAATRQLRGLSPRLRRLAVGWGRTVAAVAAALPAGWPHGIEIVQTNGGPAVARGNPVGNSLYALAEKGPGTVRALAGPTILGSARTAKALRRDASIAGTLAAAERSAAMLFSPGAVDPDSVLVQSGYIGADQIADLSDLGVVGDVMSHFILEDGTPADQDLDERTLSISLDAVRNCPTVIGVVTGDKKKAATLAVVKAGLVTTLITDSCIPAYVLASSQGGDAE